MSSNFLKLNSGKTEVLVMGTWQQLKKLNITSLNVAGVQVTLQQKPVRNLGVMFDKNMTMSSHVMSLVKSVSYHTRNISRIRRNLTTDSAKKLVNSLVTSRLDYCNSLLVGISGGLLKRLQCAQDWAARVVLQLPRSVDPPLQELHWLPVSKRIDYKLTVTVFKAIHGLAPDYINELIIPVTAASRTRLGEGSYRLHVSRTTNGRGDRTFKIAGPNLWNKLPKDLRAVTNIVDFKRKLKTHFYIDAFNVKRQ